MTPTAARLFEMDNHEIKNKYNGTEVWAADCATELPLSTSWP